MECRRVRRSATDTAGFAAEDLRRGICCRTFKPYRYGLFGITSEIRPVASDSLVESVVAKARPRWTGTATRRFTGFCFSALDLTTLSGSDSVRSVAEFVKARWTYRYVFPGCPMWRPSASILLCGHCGSRRGGDEHRRDERSGRFPRGADLPRSEDARSGDGCRERRRRNRCGDECGRNGGGRVRLAGQRPRTCSVGKPDRK